VLKVVADKGVMISADTVSIGLIVPELVINSLKYAFPEQRDSAALTVCYESNDAGWKLSVSDNGVGRPDGGGVSGKGGLGTSLVNTLANQLDAKVSSTTGSSGWSVSIVQRSADTKFCTWVIGAVKIEVISSPIFSSAGAIIIAPATAPA